MSHVPKPRSAAEMARFLEGVAPRGEATKVTDPTSRWARFLTACGGELSRLSQLAWNLLHEAVPGSYDPDLGVVYPAYTIAAWESDLGLIAVGSLPQRKAAIKAHLLAKGGNSAAYFTALILNGFGVAITIETFTPIKPCSPPCWPLYSTSVKFAWRVHGPAATAAQVRANIEALINKYRPAHTYLWPFAWDL